ncbi:MAG: DUF350 domain-containing protein [Myxococcales bacterium]|nr:DUF350 domain-containing protein [Myxococcales bacterium]MCB9673156.1 DUF350 domain-containing protein [Alphaproteobacteria bacterium]
MNRKFAPVLLAGCALLVSTSAFANDGPTLNLMGIAASVLYGFLGILLAVVGYKVFELVLPFDVTKELSEDDNPAVGVLMAAVVLGVSIIMAAAIHG